MFPEEAFEFVRDGLRHTVELTHGQPPPANELGELPDDSRHVSGQQMCFGLRDLALQRYGMLASTVLNRWSIRKTDDFGTIVYAMIDRKELRASDRDSIEDFRDVYDFAEAFGNVTIG